MLKSDQAEEIIDKLQLALEPLELFNASNIKAAIKQVQQLTGFKGKDLYMPIRVATTGQTHGPELPQVMQLIGKERLMSRLQ